MKVAFLTTGPEFTCSVPSSFHPVPELASPIAIAPDKGRTCVFSPVAIGDNIVGNDTYRLIGTREGAGKTAVEVYEQAGDSLWFLRWPLNGGSVSIHIRRKEDGEYFLDSVAKHLVVIERPDGIASVIPTGPLRRMVSARPGYEEVVTFCELDGSSLVRTLHLRRPSRIRDGVRMEHESGNPSGVRIGGRNATEVSVSSASSRQEAIEVAQRVLNVL